MTSGENWRREYLAWPLLDLKDVGLSIDCNMVHRQLREPIVAERISLVADKITFPLKNEHERVNTTLEGIKDIVSSREGPEGLEMVDVDSHKPKLRYISEGYAHYSEGAAGDGHIYADDDGYNVKLDKLGRRYRVGSDGVRQVPTREEEEAIRTRDAIEKKSRPKAPRAREPAFVEDADDENESMDEFAECSPDATPMRNPSTKKPKRLRGTLGLGLGVPTLRQKLNLLLLVLT